MSSPFLDALSRSDPLFIGSNFTGASPFLLSLVYGGYLPPDRNYALLAASQSSASSSLSDEAIAFLTDPIRGGPVIFGFVFVVVLIILAVLLCWCCYRIRGPGKRGRVVADAVKPEQPPPIAIPTPRESLAPPQQSYRQPEPPPVSYRQPEPQPQVSYRQQEPPVSYRQQEPPLSYRPPPPPQPAEVIPPQAPVFQPPRPPPQEPMPNYQPMYQPVAPPQQPQYQQPPYQQQVVYQPVIQPVIQPIFQPPVMPPQMAYPQQPPVFYQQPMKFPLPPLMPEYLPQNDNNTLSDSSPGGTTAAVTPLKWPSPTRGTPHSAARDGKAGVGESFLDYFYRNKYRKN